MMMANIGIEKGMPNKISTEKSLRLPLRGAQGSSVWNGKKNDSGGMSGGRWRRGNLEEAMD
jgi:hypothetical protein